MAQTIKLKRSASTGNIPTIGQLELGEIAINTHDGKLFIKKNDGADAIVELGSGGASELEKVQEGSNTGWRLLGQDPLNYGDIGDNALDFSYSSEASTTNGATGDYSFAAGSNTLAINTGSHAVGLYNIGTSTETIHETGMGTGSASRANAFEIYTDGRIRAPGQTIALHDAPRSLATKEYVDSLVTSSELEKVQEGGNIGHRILGRDEANYGDTGQDAIDLSNSLSASSTLGAVGKDSIATGIDTMSNSVEQAPDPSEMIELELAMDTEYIFPMTSEIAIVSQPIAVNDTMTVSAGIAIMNGNDGSNNGDCYIYIFDVTSIPIEQQSDGDEIHALDNNSSGGEWDENGELDIPAGVTSIQFLFTGDNTIFETCSIDVNQDIKIAVDITDTFNDYSQDATYSGTAVFPIVEVIGGTFTQGIGTQTRNNAQSALGQYNIGTSPDTIHEIGIGIDDANRANGLVVYLDGRVHVPGLSPDSIIENKSIITKEYFDINSGSGNLKSDGTVDMDVSYTPVNSLSLATKEYVDSNTGGTDTLAFTVKNTGGTNLLKGQAVSIIGYDNTGGVIEISVADQSTSVANGILNEDIDNDAQGIMISTGVIRDIDTSMFVESDILYLGSNGGFTTTEPTTGYMQPIAYVLRENATLGILQVNADYPKQDADDVRYDTTSSVKTELDTKISSRTVENQSGDGTTTLFTLVNPYITGAETLVDVFVDGLLKIENTHYTLANGTDLTFDSAPSNGSIIIIKILQ